MAIAKTASRNVAFKVAKMRDAIMEDQDELITRKSDSENVILASEANKKGILEDIGCNADLYIAPIKRTIFKFRRLTSVVLSSASKFRSSTMLA